MLHGDISLSGYSKIRVKIKFMYVCKEKKWNKAKRQGANSPQEVLVIRNTSDKLISGSIELIVASAFSFLSLLIFVLKHPCLITLY